jgi:signal transduction histidine kinase
MVVLDTKPSSQSEQVLVRGLLRAIAVFRWFCVAWAGVALFFRRDDLDTHAVWAWSLIGLMVLTSALLNFELLRAPERLLHPLAIGGELAVSAIVLVGDGLVFSDGRVQSLPWAWPQAAVMTAGLAFGWRGGFIAGLWTAAWSYIGEGLILGRTDLGISLASKSGLFILVGVLSGYLADRLRKAEREISTARAREEMARQLHDGVLQTLAVIQRRSSDPELSTLARDQEHDLRAFLAGEREDGSADLESRLHGLAARHESMFGGRVQVVVAEDTPSLLIDDLDAVIGAAGEALTNAGKHGSATSVNVYAEPTDDDRLFISIKDDGVGFVVDDAARGRGIPHSIEQRMHERGGRVDIKSRPGSGTEVRLWTGHTKGSTNVR